MYQYQPAFLMCLVDNRGPRATLVPTRIPHDLRNARCTTAPLITYQFCTCFHCVFPQKVGPLTNSYLVQQEHTRIITREQPSGNVRPEGRRSIYHKKQRLQLTQGISNNHLFSIMYINALCIGDKGRVHLWNMNAANFLSMYLCDYRMLIRQQ